MAAKKTKTAICFDVDGTLIDSTHAHIEAFNLALKKNNLQRRTYDELFTEFGPPAEEIVRKMFPKIPFRKVETIVKDKNEFLIKKTADLVKPIPGALEALHELRKKYKLAVISNSVHDEVVILLRKGAINPKMFSAIMGKDDTPHPKPSPDEILAVSKKLNTKVEYIVGDTVYDIRAGKAADVKTVAVLSGVQNIKVLGDENPTFIIKSVAILPDILFGRI